MVGQEMSLSSATSAPPPPFARPPPAPPADGPQRGRSRQGATDFPAKFRVSASFSFRKNGKWVPGHDIKEFTYRGWTKSCTGWDGCSGTLQMQGYIFLVHPQEFRGSDRFPSTWVWVQMKPPGDRRLQSLAPFTRVPFWVRISDP